MENFLTTQFNGKNIATYLWMNKPCWIAIQIVKLFDYLAPSKVLFHCIKRECFVKGLDYEILTGDTLRRFKASTGLNTTDIRYAPKLIIFYESGLYGFLGYSDKPEATPFKSFVRHKILPSIRRDGCYVINDLNNSIHSTNFKNEEPIVTSNIDTDKIDDLDQSNITSKNYFEKIKPYIDTADISNNAKLNLILNLYESLGFSIGNKNFIDNL